MSSEPKSESRWIALLSSLMLLIGICLGIAMDRFLFRPPPPPLPPVASGERGSRFGEMALQRMTRNLDLSAGQQEKMREIFTRYTPELRRVRMMGGDFTAIRMKMSREIRKVLTPEQFRKFEESFRRRMMRFQQMREPGVPPATPAPPAPPAGR